MRLVDTRAYVGMLRELVEQGKEVRMVISGSSMAPFLIHGRDSIFFRTPERELRKGDIVFYERPGGQFVVHRICGVHGESYDLIGDGQTEIEHNVQRILKWLGQGEKEQKSSIEVGAGRVELLKKYDMIRTADWKKRGDAHAGRIQREK